MARPRQCDQIIHSIIRNHIQRTLAVGEVSQCSWSPIFQVGIQPLHCIAIATYFLFESNPILLNLRPTEQ